MAHDGVDDAFDALNERFASELVNDEDARFAQSMAALRALGEFADDDTGAVDCADEDNGSGDADDLSRVLAALELEVTPEPADAVEPEIVEANIESLEPEIVEADMEPLEAELEVEPAEPVEPEIVEVAPVEAEPVDASVDTESELIDTAGDEAELNDSELVDTDLEIPLFLKEWTHSTDEQQILAELFPTDDPAGTPQTPEPAADTDQVTEPQIAEPQIAEPPAAEPDPEIPAFVNTGEHRLERIAAQAPSEDMDVARSSAAVDELPAAGAVIIPVGAARRHYNTFAAAATPELEPERDLRPQPPSPWGPRIAAGAGITMLIIGSAVLWITLLGSPRSSAADAEPLTAATAVPTSVESPQDPEAPADRATVMITDDRLSAEITRCDTTGMSGHLSTSGSEWHTARIQGTFVSALGEVLTASNPVEELVPTTIRVPFNFGYDPSLAPAGLEAEDPWCEVVIDVVPGP